MTKEERAEKTQNVLSRIKKIQNTTKNIGWGTANYFPLMDLKETKNTDSQWVIVVGHNVYRKIHTMFLEVFKNGKYSLSVMTNRNTVGEFLAESVDEEELIQVVCRVLRTWYPEKRKGDL